MEEGYTNSQTWEAWKDSFNVLWDNTEIVFLISVTVSLGAVLITWWFYPRANDSSESTNPICEVAEELTSYDSLTEEDVIEETMLTSYDSLTQEDVIEETMVDDEPSFDFPELKTSGVQEKEEERNAQNQQLEAIFKLMQEQQEKFGRTSMDDIKDQMRFYCR